MSRTTTVGVILAAAVGCFDVVTYANGGAAGASAPSSSMSSSIPRTPEEIARDSYNSGIDHRDKGDKLEAKAVTEKKDGDRIKDLAKAADEYKKALKDFQKSAATLPTFAQAYNGMGYANRKTGDYTTALAMYDKALTLAPGFPDAIEYRGVAYLKLNRLDDAKAAYLDLFARDRKQADALMKEMDNWVKERATNPGTLDAAAVGAFSSWLQERAKVASTTTAMSLVGHRSIWD
jgi:tetratricopeptide (TPR) repeat protein